MGTEISRRQITQNVCTALKISMILEASNLELISEEEKIEIQNYVVQICAQIIFVPHELENCWS